jgi:antagonist of KipI
MNRMLVRQPGMFSLLQDSGRHGSQQYGVPVNGPMDEWSARLANALLGNEEGAAVLEITLTGPSVSFEQDMMIAVCGARFDIRVGDRPLPYDRAVLLRKRTPLVFGERQDGARAYLAVRGGFATDAVLGSRSTNVRGAFGGFQGRALQRTDAVPVPARRRGEAGLALARQLVQSGLPMVSAPAVPGCALPPLPPLSPAPAPSTTPATGKTGRVRFIPGPQWARFSSAAQADFTSRPYVISNQSDRMGYRLEGPALALREALEMVSEATPFGTVQVPPDGQPIVLMADRQSAGGYPKIGYVISADLPRLAQALPGESLLFLPVTQEQAEALWLEFEDRLRQARQAAAAALA